MQGFLFSRPRPADEMEVYLRAGRRTSGSDDLRRIEIAIAPALFPLEAAERV
jgi:hypothetical protein